MWKRVATNNMFQKCGRIWGILKYMNMLTILMNIFNMSSNVDCCVFLSLVVLQDTPLLVVFQVGLNLEINGSIKVAIVKCHLHYIRH
jgi:hypothetical protein